MRKPIIAGNWKMYKTIGAAVELVKALLVGLESGRDREVLVCPPFTALYAVRPLLVGTAISLGAQDLHHEAQGAYTGAIAPGMLTDVGCSYVIIGHSERRQYFGETDASVNKKIGAALGVGLKPIVCVGEVKAERDAGQAEAVVDLPQGQHPGVSGQPFGAVRNDDRAVEIERKKRRLRFTHWVHLRV